MSYQYNKYYLNRKVLRGKKLKKMTDKFCHKQNGYCVQGWNFCYI